MTTEQIFELMEKHFHLCPVHDSACIEYIGKESDFLKFALKIHEMGYNKGYNEGYESGSTGVFGEPLG
jgi:hypothetical protein